MADVDAVAPTPNIEDAGDFLAEVDGTSPETNGEHSDPNMFPEEPLNLSGETVSGSFPLALGCYSATPAIKF